MNISIIHFLQMSQYIWKIRSFPDGVFTLRLTHDVYSQFYSVLDGDEDMIFMHVDNPGGTVSLFFGSSVK